MNYLSGLSYEWAPTLLETREEFDFLRENMGLFISSYDHLCFIGGSFCYKQNRVWFSHYSTDESGNIIEFFHNSRLIRRIQQREFKKF